MKTNLKANQRNIVVIDDEPTVCDSLRSLFESMHFCVHVFHSATAFLNHKPPLTQGCLIIDVRMPVMSGLELLEHLNAIKNRLPVIIITGYADIPMAIRAMKLGAHDFILKPFNNQYLLEVIQKCMNKPINTHNLEHINDRVNLLSERERQVIELIIAGKLNKEIAYDLSISISTVEVHRANIMRKMQAKNLAQLIKFYLQSHFNLELQT